MTAKQRIIMLVSSSRAPVLALACAAAVSLAACGGDDDDASGASGSRTITAWTLEYQEDRVATQKQILAKFTEKTGVKVNLRAIEEDQLRTLVSSAAAGGTLPDVILALPLSYVHNMAAQQISDPDVANEIVEKLGKETFSERALDLVSHDGQALAVPSDAWGQMVVYRKDLFEQAGLAPPDSFEALQAAAERLHGDDVAGIALGTTPETFTQESFEGFALANGCQLVEGDELTLNTPACERALDLYAGLARDASVKGNQDFLTARATYFAGKSAMVVWSSFLLDELAGLIMDERPSCKECRKDPQFLAKNSGVVTKITGPDGSGGAQYGDETVFQVMAGAGSGTSELVDYLMSDGYIDWIAMAPEGKIPVRLGTASEPTQYIDAWSTLEIGVDEKRPLDEVFGDEVIEAVKAGPEQFDRWGFGHGDQGGQLVGAALGELPMTKAVAEVIAGDSSAADALATAQDSYQQLKDGLR